MIYRGTAGGDDEEVPCVFANAPDSWGIKNLFANASDSWGINDLSGSWGINDLSWYGWTEACCEKLGGEGGQPSGTDTCGFWEIVLEPLNGLCMTFWTDPLPFPPPHPGEGRNGGEGGRGHPGEGRKGGGVHPG